MGNGEEKKWQAGEGTRTNRDRTCRAKGWATEGRKKKPPSLGETRLRRHNAVFKWDSQPAVMACVEIFQISFFSQQWRPALIRFCLFVLLYTLFFPRASSRRPSNIGNSHEFASKTMERQQIACARPRNKSYQSLQCTWRINKRDRGKSIYYCFKSLLMTQRVILFMTNTKNYTILIY